MNMFVRMACGKFATGAIALCLSGSSAFGAFTATNANLLVKLNPSFEVGLRGDGVFRGGAYVPPKFSALATDGGRSLQIAPGERYDTVMISVTPGRSYQWSFDLCATNGTAAVVGASCSTSFIGAEGMSNPIYGSANVAADPGWKRFAVKIDIPKRSIPWVFLRIWSPQRNQQADVLVDAMRLSEVEPTVVEPLPYAPAYPVEVSLSTPASEDSLFDQPGSIELKLTMSRPGEASLMLRDVLYGTEQQLKLERNKDGFIARADLPVGMYLADASVPTERGTLHVYRALAVADHRPLRPHTFNPLGAHFAVTKPSVRLAQWLGFETLVYLNQKTFFDVVEPKPGQFVFPADEDVALARDGGITFVGHLTYGVKTPPAWLEVVPAGKGDWGWQKMIPTPKDRHHWREYVKAMATHYREQVKYWEILSEPNGVMTAEDYVPLLKEAYEAIKEVDPGITVVGISSTWDHQVDGFHFIKDALKLGAGKYLDVLSMHPYTWPESAEDRHLEPMMENLRKLRDEYAPHAKLWVTEWSFVSRTLDPGRPVTRRGSGEVDPSGRTPIQTAAYYVRTAMIHLSEGFERTCVMGALSDGLQAWNGAAMTWRDYDNTVLPAYLAWHELNHQIVGGAFDRSLPLATEVRAKLWKYPDGGKLIALWRVDGQRTEVGDLPPTLMVKDMLGRQIKGPIQIGGEPLYVSGPSEAVERFATKLTDLFGLKK